MTRATERWTAAIEANEALDRPSYDVAHATSLALHPTGTAAKPIQNALHGTWLGHPLHPALATLPIGAWTLAFALDTSETLRLGRSGSTDRTADVALGAGTAAAVAAAAAGLADYRKVHGRDRRTGLVHAVLNTTALVLSAGSLALRRRGHRGAGRAASAAGWASMMAGAYLGGHLVTAGGSASRAMTARRSHAASGPSHDWMCSRKTSHTAWRPGTTWRASASAWSSCGIAAPSVRWDRGAGTWAGRLTKAGFRMVVSSALGTALASASPMVAFWMDRRPRPNRATRRASWTAWSRSGTSPTPATRR
ncbi:Uncharacterized membrane protein [Citreimonas salinaria]|uniref:Uncharacterized membrane protein n=1 Tax=Citreimonas salinaria TaxID=321339 RepID=A0A1H3H2X2_9RHOB|nr:DUF2231 domain-containing protein [Citreimonas salinaria]SDY09876.1 Uncharacterized membrane protein [Citreimonas salinaria]